MCTSNYTQQKEVLEIQLANLEQEDPRYAQVAQLIEDLIELIELATKHRHPGYDIPHTFNLDKCCKCCVLDKHESCLDMWEEMYYQVSNDRNPNQEGGITPELYQKVINEIDEFYETHPATEFFMPEEMNRINLTVLGGRFMESVITPI